MLSGGGVGVRVWWGGGGGVRVWGAAPRFVGRALPAAILLQFINAAILLQFINAAILLQFINERWNAPCLKASRSTMSALAWPEALG